MRKILLSFLFLSFPLYLNAQHTLEYNFQLGPRTGFYIAHESNGASLYAGVQGRVRLGDYFGAEGSFEYRGGQEYDLETTTAKTKFIPLTASGLIFMPFHEQFTPYVAAGLGAYYSIYDFENGNDNSFNFGSHLGLGSDISLGSGVKLNADYRYLFLDRDEVNLDGASLRGSVFTVGLWFDI